MRRCPWVVWLSFLLVGCGQSRHVLVSETPAMTAALALHQNQISAPEMSNLMDQPRDFQIQVTKELAALEGLPDSTVTALIVTGPSRTADPTSALGSCSQSVEFKTVVHDAVFSSTVSSFNSSRGTEYVFGFNPWWTVDANDIRWASTDGQVTWALWVAYGSLAGSNLCTKPCYVLVGDKGLSLAGGLDRVRRALYLHHT